MSVSHPLAADDSHENAERKLRRPGGSGPAASGDSAEGVPYSGDARSILQEQLIVAPALLGLESRHEFRRAASTLIDHTTGYTGRFVIDCSHLQAVDSAGLNALIIIQRRAAQRRIRVFLRDLNDDLQSLLVLTKLDDLFELQDGQTH